MNAGAAAFAAYGAGLVGESPYGAFLDTFAEGAEDSMISRLPIVGQIYDLYQSLGLIGQLVSSYFGWEVLSQLASVMAPSGGAFNAMSAGSVSSGAMSDAIRLARVVGQRASELISIIRIRNLNAVQGRIAARSHQRANVDEAVRYGSRNSHSSSLSRSSAQYNHLNQNAAFAPLGIARNDGISLHMEGSTSRPGTPHFEFHYSLDTFWDLYRPNRMLSGRYPTLQQYDQALRRALRHAGYSRKDANALADVARKDWAHLSPNTPFFHIPSHTVAQSHPWGVY